MKQGDSIMSYYIRTKSGEAKAKVSNATANLIIENVRGHFREAKYREGSKTVFELEGDFTYGNELYKIMLWTGDVLEPVKD